MKKKQIIRTVLVTGAAAIVMLSNKTLCVSDANSDASLYGGIIAELNSQQSNCSIGHSNLSNTEQGIVWYSGYANTECNIRRLPDENSDVIDILDYNQEVLFWDYGDAEWAMIEYAGSYAYVSKRYISLEQCKFNTIQIPTYSGFKSWMSYHAISNKSSNQYQLQQLAYTGTFGIRMVGSRYCIAVGNGTGADIGDYIDLVLDNGVVIHCVVGDIKADQHTDSSKLITVKSNCCSEFIVDENSLNENAKTDGDISACDESWNSPVSTMLVYEENVLNEY